MSCKGCTFYMMISRSQGNAKGCLHSYYTGKLRTHRDRDIGEVTVLPPGKGHCPYYTTAPLPEDSEVEKARRNPFLGGFEY